MNRKNKLILALAIGAVVILVVSTVVRCSTADRGNAVGQIVPAKSEAEGQGDVGRTPQLPRILKDSTWTSADGKCSIVFKDGRYVETDHKNTKLTTFDVASVREEDGQTAIMLHTDAADGSVKESLVLLQESEDGCTVASDDFQLSVRYRQGPANTAPIKIVGVNEEYRELLGGSTEGLSSAVSDYSHENVPSATVATWNRAVVIDYALGAATTTFRLDDAASTMITVEYTFSTADFKVMG